MKINGFGGDDFDPKDWQVDLPAELFLHRPSGLGFSVKWVRKPELSSDEANVSLLEATPVICPAGHGLSPREVLDLSSRAVGLYLEQLRKEPPPRRPRRRSPTKREA
jgi:hypothetical protein